MDVSKIQDAAMTGAARYIEWREKFLNELQEKLIRDGLRETFAQMPDVIKEAIKQQDPEGYKQVMSLLEGE